ncbi:hypothetical protein MT1_2744 [Pseudomonas sp. MT-1]|nr:hypothetical protein MT1_2744 [Pseudomonas sp. MT-1]
MAVSIYKPWSKKHPGKVTRLFGHVLFGVFTGCYQHDAPVTDSQCVVLQHNTCWLDWDEPGRK